MPKNFPEFQVQRNNARALQRRLLTQRLRNAGCSEAMVVAFTANRLRTVHGLK